MKKNIRIFVMDVDGTLTDGKIYFGESGELFKAFHVKDGYGIKKILPEYNILPVIITGRDSKLLPLRCQELEIRELYQNVQDKVSCLKELLQKLSQEEHTQYGFEHCAYIGDDVPDLECMQFILSAGGLVGCPSDAIDRIVAISDFVSPHKGGDGAVRDFIEWMVSNQ